MTFRIGYLVFPDITQLDLTGPQQVLARVPGPPMPTARRST
jgi:cyclohexyl-isocyanide hydratase